MKWPHLAQQLCGSLTDTRKPVGRMIMQPAPPSTSFPVPDHTLFIVSQPGRVLSCKLV